MEIKGKPASKKTSETIKIHFIKSKDISLINNIYHYILSGSLCAW